MTEAELKQYYYLEKEIKMNNSRLEENDRQRKRILKNIRKCEKLQKKIEKFIDDIEDSYIRQIFYLRFIKRETWVGIAMKVSGGNSTDEATRAYVRRYLAKIEREKRNRESE